MELILNEGEKFEKKAVSLPSESKQEEAADLEILKQINEKLDLLLQAEKVGTEE